MDYWMLKIPLDGVDHFLLELDADGKPLREIGLDASGGVLYRVADKHSAKERCIWHSQFNWEIEPFLADDDAYRISSADFEATWDHGDRSLLTWHQDASPEEHPGPQYRNHAGPRRRRS